MWDSNLQLQVQKSHAHQLSQTGAPKIWVFGLSEKEKAGVGVGDKFAWN